MMAELELPATATAVAQYYGDLLDGFVIDQSDKLLVESIGQMGVEVSCTATIMKTLQDRIDLANAVVSFGRDLSEK